MMHIIQNYCFFNFHITTTKPKNSCFLVCNTDTYITAFCISF